MADDEKNLDQFYTDREVARTMTAELSALLPRLGYDVSEITFFEPSAGTGSFVEAVGTVFPGVPVFASDLDPKADGIVEGDFLTDSFHHYLPNKDRTIIIGNPPFGKKSKLVLDFINRGWEYADTIAFIVPVQMRKYLTQKNVNPSAKLVLDVDCPEDSFVFKGKSYDVRCCFQVWTVRESTLENLRVTQKPRTSHPDFTMKIYNCTEGARKFLDEDWDFAVLRQGWKPFVPVFPEEKPLNPRKQWMTFTTEIPQVRANLLSLDFNKLGEKNTSVRGFGKADVVEEYEKLYGNLDQ